MPPRDRRGQFVDHLGGRRLTIQIPGWLLSAGALIGDMVAQFGWKPPLRSTAIYELRRGVAGDPLDWIRNTGIAPAPVDAVLARYSATIQEKWFPCSILDCLIPPLVSFDAATTILTGRGIGTEAARISIISGSIADILIGCAIAIRSTCRIGLIVKIGLAAAYLTVGTQC